MSRFKRRTDPTPSSPILEQSVSKPLEVMASHCLSNSMLDLDL